MKYFIDGNQLVITKDDFINIQESPVVFRPLEGEFVNDLLMIGDELGIPLIEQKYKIVPFSIHGTLGG